MRTLLLAVAIAVGTTVVLAQRRGWSALISGLEALTQR